MLKQLSLAFFVMMFAGLGYAKPYSIIKGSTYNFAYWERTDEQVVYFGGEIFYDLRGLANLTKFLKSGKSIRLVIENSDGGLVLAYQRFGRLLQSVCAPKGVKVADCTLITEVRDYCGSACVRLFMLGEKRIASKTAQFGFHRAWFIHRKFVVQNSERVLVQLGVNAEWVRKHPEVFSIQEGVKLTPYQLDGSNIITEIK